MTLIYKIEVNNLKKKKKLKNRIRKVKFIKTSFKKRRK